MSETESQPVRMTAAIPRARGTAVNWDAMMVFDTETTGTNPKEDRVVELGVARFDGPRVRRFPRRLNPDRPIPPEASAVHGIHDPDVASCPRFAQVAGGFFDFLDSGAVLVGYNAHGYDIPIINAELARCGHPGRLYPAQVLDVLVFVRWHLRDVRSRGLADLCTIYNVPLLDAHSAAADAEATGWLLRCLVDAGFIPADPAAALAEQAVIVPQLEDEARRWTYWLYRSRAANNQRLILGCGKHNGVPLCKVDPGYCKSLVALHNNPDKSFDLPADVLRLFELRAAGKTDGAVIHGE